MGKLQDAINITGIDLTADELKILYHAWIQPQSFPLDVPIVGHDYAEEQLALWRTFLIRSGLLEYDPESCPLARIGAKGRELIENCININERRKMKYLTIGLIFSSFVCTAAPSITSVTAQQRYPWNGKVYLSYSVSGDVASHSRNYGLIPSLKVTATDKVANKTYTATKLSGDTALTDGTHKLVWDLDAQGLAIKSSDVVFNVSCETTEATYCVIDLSAGANATSYPVTYLASEPSGGFNVNAYKTTKLVLKRIKAGSFIMGEDQSDQSHKVTLTKPFYMGIFEVTQKQWALVMGSKAQGWDDSYHGAGDAYPAYYVSYDRVRGASNGAKWPSSSSVDASSFLGKLQSRAGFNFDLPTEAQWEYACRAGTTTAYYWGSSMNEDYAWYSSNSGLKTHPVGGKKPNAWGLYDMSGNVWEWNLDWSGNLAYGTDPKGSVWTYQAERIARGGAKDTEKDKCTSFYRSDFDPSMPTDYVGFDFRCGFRLSRTLP